MSTFSPSLIMIVIVIIIITIVLIKVIIITVILKLSWFLWWCQSRMILPVMNKELMNISPCDNYEIHSNNTWCWHFACYEQTAGGPPPQEYAARQASPDHVQIQIQWHQKHKWNTTTNSMTSEINTNSNSMTNKTVTCVV